MSTASRAEKPLPLIVSLVVGGPTEGESTTPGRTTKFDALVAGPPVAATRIRPVEASVGTTAWIEVLLATEYDAATLLNATEVTPVKPDPAIETTVPSGPDVGENDEIEGAAQLTAGHTA